MKKIIGIIGIVLTLSVLFWLSQFTILEKHKISGEVSGIFAPISVFVGSIFASSQEPVDPKALIRENEMLKAEILRIKNSPEAIKRDGQEFINAKIYSTYPFNNRNLISLNAGSLDGITLKSAVTAEGSFLLGQIIEVFPDYSVARTIFDPGWELPVKIGTQGIDALLIGGRDPKLTLITNEEDIKANDEVYSAGKEFPYGFKIGEIRSEDLGADAAFQQFSLWLSYDFKDLNQVSILKK